MQSPPKSLLERLEAVDAFDRRVATTHKGLEHALVGLCAFQTSQSGNRFVSAEYFSCQKPLTYVETAEDGKMTLFGQKNEEKQRDIEFFGFESNYSNAKEYQRLQASFKTVLEDLVGLANHINDLRRRERQTTTSDKKAS